MERICPICGREIYYKSKKGFIRAEKNNANCKHCSNILREYKTPSGKGHQMYGKKHKIETIEKLKKNARVLCGNENGFYGKTHSNETREKMKTAWKNRLPVSNETREKLSKMRKGIKKTEEHKRKLRIARIQFIENNHGICFPSFNKKACEYFDSLNKKMGWNLEHALRAGEFRIKELGYWLDGYDKEKNIVVEYDEPFHYKNGELREKDVLKMKEVKEYLGCKFFRYNESENELREYI